MTFLLLAYSLSSFDLLESHIAQFHIGLKKVIRLFLGYLSLSEFDAPS